MESHHQVSEADLINSLEAIGVFAKFEDIQQFQNNTLSYIPKDLIAGMYNVFEGQKWIAVKYN